jgi:hypothetical protein
MLLFKSYAFIFWTMTELSGRLQATLDKKIPRFYIANTEVRHWIRYRVSCNDFPSIHSTLTQSYHLLLGFKRGFFITLSPNPNHIFCIISIRPRLAVQLHSEPWESSVRNYRNPTCHRTVSSPSGFRHLFRTLSRISLAPGSIPGATTFSER